MNKTAIIMSQDEAMALPLKERPICYRISSEIYHAIFEAVGAASMCWKPRPKKGQYNSEAAEKIAVDLCFKVAQEKESVLQAPNTNVAIPPLDGFEDQQLPKWDVGDGVMHNSFKCTIDMRLWTPNRGWVYGVNYYPSGGGSFWWEEKDLQPMTDAKVSLAIKASAARARIARRNHENQLDNEFSDSLETAIANLP